MARPRKEINWDEFDKLCQLHATQTEIASWFAISVDTIDRAVKRTHGVGFAEYYAQKAAGGKISLRRQQWQMAMKGDKTMLIWLGKQHLEQSDKMDQRTKNEHTVREVPATPESLRAELDDLRKKQDG